MPSPYYEVECAILNKIFDTLPSTLPESPPGSKLPPILDSEFLKDEGSYAAFNKAMHASYGDKTNGIRIVERGSGLTMTVQLVKWCLIQLEKESAEATAELVGLWIIALITAAEAAGGTLQDEGVFLSIFDYFDF
jgi:hypothetical protein